MTTMTRQQVATDCGVSTRTVSRWASQGVLTKYLDVLNQVVFDSTEVQKIKRARPAAQTPRKREAVPVPAPRRPRRW
jgi:hypothetical protein